MKTLFIIGNGFDLAHGLKTSYKDFIEDYLKQIFEVVEKNSEYNDDLITIKFEQKMGTLDFIKKLSQKSTGFEKLEYCQFNTEGFQIEFHFELLKKSIKNFQNFRWVDVEYEYYKLLQKCLGSDEEKIYQEIQDLNKLFESFKNLFFKYIFNENAKITRETRFEEMFDFLKSIINEQIDKHNICFLSFNYTSLANLYYQNFKGANSKFIQIHGSCDNNLSNPQIFGYGDEMDKRLGDLEDINIQDAFKNIKSINYSKNQNYKQLYAFMTSSVVNSIDGYNVKVIGHSCGLSDRTLLNEIFESELCHSITLYHYRKDENNTDFEEKYSEIFRQFKEKTLLRKKVETFNKDHFIPQWND